MSSKRKKTENSSENISSPKQSQMKKSREWTKEEMEEAQPCPMPEVADDH
ncbi:MAG: hypothetical protein QNJ42_00295 [Crocosphaera sp.]|nr:hypothetical protein [Crocosphaera sp.]